jgi:RimJ/RimL family protein N-acetyltransferase
LVSAQHRASQSGERAVVSVILESKRLRLRTPRREDLASWIEMYGDAELTKYAGGVLTVGQAWSRIMAIAGSWSLMGFGPFAIEVKTDGRWAGCAGPWQPQGWPGLEIGWRLARWAHGQGYATEAAALAMDWTFDALKAPEVIHTIDVRNQASIAVAERLGSRRTPERAASGVCGDAIWTQSSSDWAGGNRARFFDDAG